MSWKPIVFLGASLVIAAGVGMWFGDGIWWRAVDLLALAFGSVGIFGLIGEARRLEPSNRIGSERTKAESPLITLTSICSSYAAISRFRVDYGVMRGDAPETFQAYEAATPWFEQGADFLEQAQGADLPDLLPWTGQLHLSPGEKELILMRDDVLEVAQLYSEGRQGFIDMETVLERSALEELAIFVAPYVISVAIALSFMKAAFAGP